jgi:hypothetical protein
VDAIMSAAFGALGGRPWEAAETQLRDGGNLGQILQATALAVAPAKDDEGTREMFVRRLALLGSIPERDLEESFVATIRWRSRDDNAAQSARFALMLTASPVAACRWAGNHALSPGASSDAITDYLGYLCSAQFIARAARYVTLLRLAVTGGR